MPLTWHPTFHLSTSPSLRASPFSLPNHVPRMLFHDITLTSSSPHPSSHFCLFIYLLVPNYLTYEINMYFFLNLIFYKFICQCVSHYILINI